MVFLTKVQSQYYFDDKLDLSLVSDLLQLIVYILLQLNHAKSHLLLRDVGRNHQPIRCHHHMFPSQ